ncbi:MAG: hypothetical protein DCC55_35260 [Chloroflexi bacterium]|nr:MAG: hypothetical protein DCC55_35260 [Chloroflexota bacterium]
MEKNGKSRQLKSAVYDPQSDILTFTFTAKPRPALAEEAADDVWVRFDPETHEIITIDILNFSARIHTLFGPDILYSEQTAPDRLEELKSVLLPG